ncbi:MAG: hypothetical protein Q8L34_05930 [Candidatus Woesearchaeota archaeon]|nr:hypothetical protein [Candidatus Woesearchaeota archaeon]
MTVLTPETQPFANRRIERALKNCQNAGFQVLYMPQVVDDRINGTAGWYSAWDLTTKDLQFKSGVYVTPSIAITGKTRQGSKIVVYAHLPTSLATPQGIQRAKQKGLVNGAARFSQAKLQSLVDADGKTDEQGNRLIWVNEYKPSKPLEEYVPIDKAITDQEIISFLGGEQRAARYLSTHAQEFDAENIFVRYANDFSKESPLARLLFVGLINYGLGGGSLEGFGQFLGKSQAT